MSRLTKGVLLFGLTLGPVSAATLFFQGTGSRVGQDSTTGNTPADTFVADGFVEDGKPGFTGQEAGTSVSPCGGATASGATRTGNYASAIAGAGSVTTPKPGSMLFAAAG